MASGEIIFSISNLLNIFLSLTIWNRLLINILLLLFYRSMKEKKEEIQKTFPFIIGVIFARDIISVLNNSNELLVITDILIISAYIYWVEILFIKKKFNRKVYILAALFIIAAASNMVLAYSIIFTYVYRIVVTGYVFYLSYRMYEVTVYNTTNAYLIVPVRLIMTMFLAAYNIVMLFCLNASVFRDSFIIPFSSIIHIFILFKYNRIVESGKEEEISILNESRESLFDFLKKVGSTINNRSEISGVLDYIVDTAVRSTSADAGVILLSEESEHSMNVKAVAGDYPPPYKIGEIIKVRISSVREYFKNVPVKIGESVLGEAAQTGEPIYIMDTTDDERMQYNTKYDIQYISSIIVTPLVIDNKIFGVLSIIKKKRNSFLTEQEFEKICSFAEYTSLTLDNMFTYLEVLEKREIDREVGIAADIQKRLLPQKFQNIPNTAISVISVPARGVSGDYYDVIMHKDGKVSVLICDVAGKGVPASLVMVMIRSIVHLIIGRIKGAEKVLNWVNTGIYGSVEIEHYATMSLFTYNPGNGGMEYSNAGHHPFMIYRKQTNKIETMDTEGLPVGIEPSTRYKQKNTTLHKGDIVIAYTDGIIEAMSAEGEQYGYDTLVNMIKSNPDCTTKELKELIELDLEEFTAGAKQHDDQTMIIFKSI